MFTNKILNDLFDYRGKLTSREYRALLIIIFICACACFFPYIQHKLMPNIAGYRISFNSPYWGSYLIYGFYMLITFYSTFVIAIKRARAKSLPIWMGWVGGAFTYLMFWSYLQLVSSLLSAHNTFDYLSQFYTLLPTIKLSSVVVIIGIIAIVFLSLKSRYDDETEEYDIDSEFSSYTYLFKTFNLLLIIIGITLFFNLIKLSSREFGWLISLITNITYLGLSIYYIYSRVKDAGVRVGWIFAVFGAFILLEAAYFFTGSELAVTALEYLILFRIVLIALPSKKVEEYS